MVATRWCFTAVDTLFFRDAAPFHAGEGGQGGQSSLFPPTMNTLQGAIRYQLALAQGWRPGEGSFPVELGSNDDLGELKLQGPYLYFNNQLLLPSPWFLLHLQHNYNSTSQTTYHRLSPGRDTIKCNLGEVRLPVMPSEVAGAKPMENYWLTVNAMEKVLSGGVPDAINLSNAEINHIIPPNGVVGSKELWEYEPKVGITKDPNTHTAKDKNLYAINMIRPRHQLSVVVGVEGIPHEWLGPIANQPQLVNLGGEGKLAELSVTDEQIKLPELPKLQSINGKVRFTVTLITPGYFGPQEKTAQSVLSLNPWIDSKCITACVGKIKQIGGWDLAKQRPRPLRSYIPAGSTWFFEGEEKEIDTIRSLHGNFIGDEQSNAYGYGQIIVGRWEEEK